VEDANTSSQLLCEDIDIVLKACNSEAEWLDLNCFAEKEELEYHLKKLQLQCTPILSKLCEDASQDQSSQSGLFEDQYSKMSNFADKHPQDKISQRSSFKDYSSQNADCSSKQQSIEHVIDELDFFCL